MRVLITGGLGFIGSHLVDELLKNKHKVIVITKSFSKKNNLKKSMKNLKIEKINIKNFDKLGNCIEKNKPDIIIHLAGQTSHSKSFDNPFEDIDIDVKSTLFILEKLRKMDSKCRFILGSTFVVIGKPKKLPVNEESVCSPTTIYGANKLLCENYCKIYNQVYDLDTVVFRITNSFGPREQIIPNKNAINYLINLASKGEKITIYDEGKMFRDLIYVSDVISGISTIISKGESGNIYWISSGKKTWFHQIGKWLEGFTKAKVENVRSPKYTKKVDVGNFVVDNSKLKSLGWKPKIPVKNGIKLTLDYFEDN